MDDKKIRSQVDDFYTRISEGEIATKISPIEIYRSLGYDEEDLKDLPEGVNLGLSCGNPIDKLIVKDGETILDLGSGTGLDVFIARKRFPNGGRFYGMDRLQKMVDRALKIRDIKKIDNVDFRVGTLTNIPFEDETIDHIISNCVINLEPDKNKAYKEIYRVLKKGGTISISDILLKNELSEDIKTSPNLYGT